MEESRATQDTMFVVGGTSRRFLFNAVILYCLFFEFGNYLNRHNDKFSLSIVLEWKSSSSSPLYRSVDATAYLHCLVYLCLSFSSWSITIAMTPSFAVCLTGVHFPSGSLISLWSPPIIPDLSARAPY